MGRIKMFDIETVCKEIDFFEIELCDHLTVCKQVTDVNRIVSVKLRFLKTFRCVKPKDY